MTSGNRSWLEVGEQLPKLMMGVWCPKGGFGVRRWFKDGSYIGVGAFHRVAANHSLLGSHHNDDAGNGGVVLSAAPQVHAAVWTAGRLPSDEFQCRNQQRC